MLNHSSTFTGRYRLQTKLGEGGMGVVYRAADRLTGQIIALKRVTAAGDQLQFASQSTDQDFRLSLAQEFRTLAGLRHPYIVSVLDYGFDEQRQPFFTMQLIENAQTITDYALNLSTAGKVRVLNEMLQALAYLHRRGIIHRDLKPANVLVTADGVVKVMDFGLAMHQTESITNMYTGMVGTLSYMAPELFADEPATVQSDLYAVGMMAYELFTGKYPFGMKNMAALVTSILNEKPDTTMLDFDLAEVLERLLAKTPGDRYDEAHKAIDALCQATSQSLPVENAALRESFLQAAKFVGREAELEKLTEALALAVQGQGSTWLIGGESGVGKSRLLDELRTRALVKGAVVLRGQGVEGGGLPYQLWRDPLRRLVLSTELNDLEAGVLKAIVPDISSLLERNIPDVPTLEGQAEQQRLTLTIVDVFKRQQNPVVLLLEDLQWTSESLAPLKRLSDLDDPLALLIIGTYRDDEWADLPSELKAMQVLKLQRLSDQAVAELSESMLGEIGRQERILNLLKRETEGNTFFMVEVVRSLAEAAGQLGDISHITLPEKVMAASIEQVIAQRVNRVPESLHQWLKQAALLGRQIDPLLMNHLLAVSASPQPDNTLTIDDFLTTCAHAAVLEYKEEIWRFSHDKIRDYIVTRLTSDERPHLHRQVATGLEAVYPGNVLYALSLIEHWSQAGELVRATTFIQPAFELLLRVSNYRDARSLIERGLTLTNIPDQQADLYLLLGDILTKQGNYEQAAQAFQQSLTNAQLPINMAKALNGLAIIAWRQGQYEIARHHLQRGLVFAHTAGSQQEIARNLNTLARVALYEGDFATAREYLEQASVIYREINHLQHLGVCLDNLGAACTNLGDYNTGYQYYQQSLDIARSIGSRDGIASTLTNLGALVGSQGDMATARDYFEQALVIQREIGNLYSIAMNLMNLGVVSIHLEDYRQAHVDLSEALLIQKEIGEQHSRALTLVNLVTACLKSGQNAAAGRYIHETVAVAQAGNASHILLTLVAIIIEHYSSQSLKLGQLALWTGLVLSHVSTLAEVRDTLKKSLPVLEAGLDAESLAIALEEGKTLDLDTVVQQILAEYPQD